MFKPTQIMTYLPLLTSDVSSPIRASMHFTMTQQRSSATSFSYHPNIAFVLLVKTVLIPEC